MLKTTAAVALALFGIGFAIYGLWPTRSERTDAPKPTIVTADGSPAPAAPRRQNAPEREAPDLSWAGPQNGVTYEFPRVRNAQDASELADAIGRQVDADSDARDGIGADAASVLGAVLGADSDVDEVFASLGADFGSAEESAESFAMLFGALIEHASIDVGAIEVSRTAEEPRSIGGMSINANRNRGTDEDGNEIDQTVTTVSTTLERYFPGVVGEGASGPLMTVSMPARTKDADGETPDARIRLVMRYAASVQAWQPAALHIDSVNPDIMKNVMAVARRLQSESDDNG